MFWGLENSALWGSALFKVEREDLEHKKLAK